VSLGLENSEKDIDKLIDVLRSIASKPGKYASSGKVTPVQPKEDLQRKMKDFARVASMRVYGTGEIHE
jgi:hypothetical protein